MEVPRKFKFLEGDTLSDFQYNGLELSLSSALNLLCDLRRIALLL